MKTKIMFVLVVIFLVSCSSGTRKQQRLAPEEEMENDMSFLETEMVLDTIIPAPGIKFKEKRDVDPNNLPIKIDFTKTDLDRKNLDLADYYSSVRYIKLKFPFPDKGSFLGEANLSIVYDRGMSSTDGYNSFVYLSGDRIIAGDPFQGYYCFDQQGNYLNPVYSPDYWPNYDALNNTLSLQYDAGKSHVTGFSSLGDNFMITYVKEGKGTMLFGNATTNKIYLKRPYYEGFRFHIVSPKSYIAYVYNPANEKAEDFMYSMDIMGDMLCRFYNYNPRYVNENSKASYYSQSGPIMYVYEDQLTIRQTYNDTIFRMKSSSELRPAYIMNFGEQKQDIRSGFGGDNSNKLILQEWLETSGFVWMAYSQDRDTYNNRKSGDVKFFYRLYDKKDKTLYDLPSNLFPEEFLMNNTLGNGIPTRGYFAKANEKMMYESFTRTQIKTLLSGEIYNSLSESERVNLKAKYDELDDSELLIMILE